ncbi:unnamed protein product (macronuclear) [Paramecium tetraurelia]|uniref:B box-type domain-containing protein n=1 Tax=Paramecium tetraurelia TaxID=5888 RepID=A0EF27_PARTE|nr:uncharacterized protein GSPATT00026241001 [Paramecium tetraurelia]CAK93918.1 unnamed protein product [Paramecium tetraurelia]|eukprot:XP_001461291.1 hypothetical protein (macronuclear) [Paramecium tetraurelia strain d4-2]
MNPYCTMHKEDIVNFCVDQNCQTRCLCKQCKHEHETVPISYLIDNIFVKETISIVNLFKVMIQKLVQSIETDLTAQLQEIQYEKPPNEITQLSAFLKKKHQIFVILKDSIQSKLQRVIEAIKQPTSSTKTQFPSSLNSLPFMDRQDGNKQSSNLKHFKSEEHIGNSHPEKIDENLMLDKLEIPRLKTFNEENWPWRLEQGAQFVMIFTALRNFKLLGFKQPMLFCSQVLNHQRKPVNFNVGLYHKKNLQKKPIYTESRTIKHKHEKVIDRCYDIVFKTPQKIQMGKEYSLVIWSNSGFYSHYYSLPAPANDFMEFQQQDYNDHPKIKRSELVHKVISTFRAGLIPAVYIDPRQENDQ